MNIATGDTVRNTTSGFTGICRGTDERAGQLLRVLIEGLVDEGQVPKRIWVAIQNVEKLAKGVWLGAALQQPAASEAESKTDEAG